MRLLQRAIAAAALLAATACATGTPYAQYSAAPPALAAGQGRILIYMTTQTGGDWRVALSLDGQTLGTIQPATFFYVDRPAGSHLVALPPPPHVDTFSQQAPTPPVTVDLVAGQVAYVAVSIVRGPGTVSAVLAPADASAARSDLEKLDLVPPAPL